MLYFITVSVKNLLNPRMFAMPRVSRQFIPAVLLFGASALTTFGQGAPKVYVLFQGMDISIGQGGVLKPVTDVSGSSWVVNVKGQESLISPNEGPISMKMTPGLKLTEVTATVSDLRAEGAYTFMNDPVVKLTQGLNQAASVNVASAAASNQSSALTITSLNGSGTGGSVPKAGTNANSSNQPASQAQVANTSTDMLYQGQWNTAAGFDLLHVSFGISAPKRIEQPYLVVVTKFHDLGAEAGSFRNLVYAKALEPIDTKVMNVKFEQSGFPVGFDLLGLEFHLYNRGVEIATNVSQKRTEMTSAEAFDYIKSLYLKAHKTDTLSPTPVMADSLPADLHEKLTSGSYSSVFYVKVSKDGVGEEPFADASCSTKIDDPYLEAVVRGIRFKPALQNGTPVEGISSLNLARLRI